MNKIWEENYKEFKELIKQPYGVPVLAGVITGGIIYLAIAPFRITESYIDDARAHLTKLKRRFIGELPIMEFIDKKPSKTIEMSLQGDIFGKNTKRLK